MILFLGGPVKGVPVDWGVGAWETWIGDIWIPWEMLCNSPELRV